MLDGSTSPESPRDLRGRLADLVRSGLPIVSLVADCLAPVTLWLPVAGLSNFPLAAIASGGVGTVLALGYLIATRDRRRWQSVLTWIALVFGVGLVVLGILWPKDGPGPWPKGFITSPVMNEKVDRCIKVRGRGSPPEGYTWRVGAAPVYEQDSNYYLPRDQRADEAGWSSWPVYIGAQGDYDQDFDAVLYAVPNSVLPKYSGEDVRARPYKLSDLQADGIRIVEKVRVSRKDAATTSKDACAKEPR